ncbi:MAG TPA: site-specific integrase [Thermoanaerobaculia bacterium]|nr:site-specific integrase [Thermoanaerobaculia bacterium]
MIRARKGAGGKRWQWRVTIRGFPARTGTCPTKECARDCAKQAEAEVRSGRSASRLLLAELIDAYETAFLPGIPDSAALYRQHLAWWRRELGRYELRAVTPLLVSQSKTKLAGEVTYRGRLRSAGTVNRYLNTLSSLFTWARSPEVRLADHHPVRDVQRLKEPPGRVRWLSRPVDEDSSEFERLLAACRESKSAILFDLVVLLLSTGCRLNEILRIRRQDVRLEESGFTVAAPDAKNEEARFVPLAGLGLEIVKARLATLRPGNDHIFPGAGDQPAWLPKHAWYGALRRARVENLRLHDLRHTHGSYLGMMGKTLPEIMQALGHKSPTVALRYTHLADTHKRRVSQEVNARLGEWIGMLRPADTLEPEAARSK